MKQRIGAVIAGAGAAWWPLMALAQEAQGKAESRALGAPQDLTAIVLITLLALGGVFVIAGIGYLYRRERHLDWMFQRPDTPHDEHH